MTPLTRITGSIAAPTEVDSYVVDLLAGGHYSFDITGQTSRHSTFTLGNPVVKIYSPDGTMVARQDYTSVSTGMGENAGMLALDPHLAFTAGSSGQYTVTVESGEIADFAYDWNTYLPNSGQTLNNLNSVGTYQLEINAHSQAELIDPVVGNLRWMDHSGDARGSGATIYYDFATTNLGSSTTTATNPGYGWYNIGGFNAADQAKIEGWLSEFEAVANINFVRADANHPAAMHLMQGRSADGSTGTAWLYDKQGGQFNAGDYASDRELGRVDLLIDSDAWSNPGITSDSAYGLFMHEMGHALGLKHPGNYNSGETSARVEAAAYDNTGWSQMSYNDNVQQGFATDGGALKALDIAALQTLYGVSQSSSVSNTTWAFNETDAEYSMTIHDAGGVDTLDASGQTIGSIINLQPGSISSIGNISVPAGMEEVLAQFRVDGVFGDKAYSNVGIAFDTVIENAKGGAGDDYMVGNSLRNELTGNGGNDHLVGGDGLDTATFIGRFEEYSLENHGGQITDRVSNRDGSDSLSEVERLRFADINVAFDSAHGENAGMAYRIYKAAFDRVPDAEGLGFWINALDQGYSLEQIGNVVMTSPEFQGVYGANSSNETFVNLLYQHVLHRDADTEGFNFWNDALNAGFSRGAVLAVYTECPETIQQTEQLVTSGIQYKEWLG